MLEGNLLQAAAILADAQNQTKIADPDKAVRTNLERLIAALNRDAKLSKAGMLAVGRQFTADMTSRLEGLKWFSEFPEIADEAIRSPVFLLGLPRSGFSYFQALFERDDRFRLIQGCETTGPNSPPGLVPPAAARPHGEWVEQRRHNPALDGFYAAYGSGQDASDTCHALLSQSCGTAALHNVFRVPEYFDFMMNEADLAAIYRIHKRQLQLLQWRSAARPWVLRYPNHVIAMKEILQVYPDARFVMTHRDPVQSLAAICRLTSGLRGMTADGAIDPRQVGRDMLHFVQRQIDRIIEFDDSKQAGRVIHIDYYGLIDDPLTEMRRIHAGLGLATPEKIIRAVDEWYCLNAAAARAGHGHSLEPWGLNDAAVAEQFGDYMSRFGIPREHEAVSRLAA